jgi:hypothetical protein
MVTLALGADPTPPSRSETRAVVNALIDTGAAHSALIAGIWESYEQRGLLQRLALAPDTPPLQLAGRSFPYQLGRMWVGVVDPESPSPSRSLSAVPVIFQLLSRGSESLPFPVLIGMYDSILDRRWLLRTPDAPRSGPENRYDVGSRFGQEWWLQDEPPK